MPISLSQAADALEAEVVGAAVLQPGQSERVTLAGTTYSIGTEETLGELLSNLPDPPGESKLDYLAKAIPGLGLNVDLRRVEPQIVERLGQPTTREVHLEDLQIVLNQPPEKVALELGTAAWLKKGQSLAIPRRPTVAPRQWVDWILWSLIGVAAYLLREIARHYRLISEGEGDFLGETPWYRAQLFTDPLLAFVILLILTQIDLTLLGSDEDATFSVDLGNFPPDLLVAPAFLLGSGAYTAPSEPKNVIVTAVAGAGIAIAKTLRVVPLDFTIAVVGDGGTAIAPGGSCELTLDRLPQQDQIGNIAWRFRAEFKRVTCRQHGLRADRSPTSGLRRCDPAELLADDAPQRLFQRLLPAPDVLP